jgi:hypothetical protein
MSAPHSLRAAGPALDIFSKTSQKIKRKRVQAGIRPVRFGRFGLDKFELTMRRP